MNSESFFLGENRLPKKESGGDRDPSNVSRRTFLKALGGLAVATIVEPHEAVADGVEEPRTFSAEEKKENIDRIQAYLNDLKLQSSVFERGSKKDMCALLEPRAQYSREMLVGTPLDQEEWFRDMTSGSWPSVQAWGEKGDVIPELQFAHQPNKTAKQDAQRGTYGNAFFVNDVFISNAHQAYNSKRNFPKCRTLSGDTDIVACPVTDLSNASEVNMRDVAMVNLRFEDSSIQKSIHGTLVHIPSIHEKRKFETAEDDITITSGVLVKITPNMLKTEGNVNGFIATKDKHTKQDYERVLLRSYMAIIPSIDANGDGEINTGDVEGISGSPIFLQSDCRKKNKTPSGIVWGAGSVFLSAKKYTVVFVHGPDVLGEMLYHIDALEKSS